MKSINTYINEAFRLRDNTSVTKRKIENVYQLNSVFSERCGVKRLWKGKLGPGTKEKPINFNDIDVSGLTNFKGARLSDFDMKYIDISGWDVSNIENMEDLFHYCHDLRSVGDLSRWDVSNVTNFRAMFAECENLRYVGDLSKWKMSNATKTMYMFSGCQKLRSIGDISDWDLSHVTEIRYMFNDCQMLKTLGDLSEWKIQKNIGRENMFNGCKKLQTPEWYDELQK